MILLIIRIIEMSFLDALAGGGVVISQAVTGKMYLSLNINIPV